MANKSSLTSRVFVEVHVPSNENERSRLLGILILALATIVLIDFVTKLHYFRFIVNGTLAESK